MVSNSVYYCFNFLGGGGVLVAGLIELLVCIGLGFFRSKKRLGKITFLKRGGGGGCCQVGLST